MQTNRRKTVLTLRELEALKAKLERRIDNLKRELVAAIQLIEQAKLELAKQELKHLNKEVKTDALRSGQNQDSSEY
jgi:hypothetical protein